jgi:hypothetical protein
LLDPENSETMRIGFLVGSLLTALVLAAPAAAVPPPEPPPNPALPWAEPLETSCSDGALACLDGVVAAQRRLTVDLGCDHEAVFAATYWQLTTFMRAAVATPGFFQRPDRVGHEDVGFDEEYERQIAAWRSGDVGAVTPDYRAVFAANDAGTLTAVGDQLATIAAHVLGDMPSKALEQTDGVMRLEHDAFPFGKPDHDRVNQVLLDATLPIVRFIADHYDARADDEEQLAEQLAVLLSAWREQSWRNAEELRFIRVASGTGLAYRAKLSEIRAGSAATVRSIVAANQDTPDGTAMRDAYCAAHQPT